MQLQASKSSFIHSEVLVAPPALHSVHVLLLQDLMPYVEATVMATDTVGLQVLQKAKCFDCYATSHEAKMKGEVLVPACCLLLSTYVTWVDCLGYFEAARANQSNTHQANPE